MQQKYTYMTVLFVLGLALRSTNALNCYSCSSNIDPANKETGDAGCAAGTNTNTVDSTVSSISYVCKTTVTSTGGMTTISRTADTTQESSKTDNYCESTTGGTTCYCNSEKCNSNSIAPRNYQCYQCTSSEYFDNGCGEKFDSSSKYVKTIQGCTGCFKRTTVDYSDLSITTTRGCTRSYEIDTSCENGSGNVCGCEGELCNSAVTLKSTSLAVAALFFFIAKLLC